MRQRTKIPVPDGPTTSDRLDKMVRVALSGKPVPATLITKAIQKPRLQVKPKTVAGGAN